MTTSTDSPTESRYLTVPQLARLAEVDPVTVRRWIYSGRLRAIRTPGSEWRVPRAVAEADPLLAHALAQSTGSP